MVRTLNGDAFFDYYMNVIENGKRNYEQSNEQIVKSIDSSWVNAIYDTMISLDNIVAKPRSFMKMEEVIVPVELSKKAGADSVKHLASHSHFIDKIDGGGFVVPKKILNTYNEDSLLLYENRFIFTLINRMDMFLAKRYDMLADAEGNEFNTELKVNSNFGDKENDETVEYNLSVKLHQGTHYFHEKDKGEDGKSGGKTDIKNVGKSGGSDQLTSMEKIEFARKLIMGYMNSDFYMALLGCQEVHSPIQRTNLMIKHPDYRKCYELWQFLEKYNDAGFLVDTTKSNEEFNESYLEELNTMALFSYLSVKNSLHPENDKNIDPKTKKKRKKLKPKFVHELIDDFVDNYDITEKQLKSIVHNAIKRAYASKTKTSDDRVLVALTEALNNGLHLHTMEKRTARIYFALREFFDNKKLNVHTAKRQQNIKKLLESSLNSDAENIQ